VIGEATRTGAESIGLIRCDDATSGCLGGSGSSMAHSITAAEIAAAGSVDLVANQGTAGWQRLHVGVAAKQAAHWMTTITRLVTLQFGSLGHTEFLGLVDVAERLTASSESAVRLRS
jgi:hypothetical protein